MLLLIIIIFNYYRYRCRWTSIIW